MSDYQQTLEWLYALEAAKGMDFKLERVTLALHRFGNPQRRFPSFHVAGTNGKGSVAAMLHAILVAAGYRTGLYTSPHLVNLTERIRVDCDEITPDEVVGLTTEIQRVATSGGIELTFFEFLTVMSFVHFARQQIDVGVIEVGLGRPPRRDQCHRSGDRRDHDHRSGSYRVAGRVYRCCRGGERWYHQATSGCCPRWTLVGRRPRCCGDWRRNGSRRCWTPAGTTGCRLMGGWTSRASGGVYPGLRWDSVAPFSGKTRGRR